MAWERPSEFHKVFTIVGSFVDLRGPGSGSTYADKVAASKRSQFVFSQDGRNNNRGRGRRKYDEHRDWFYQNNRLVDALTKKGYEVNYAWGIGLHGRNRAWQFCRNDALAVARSSALVDAANKEERAFNAAKNSTDDVNANAAKIQPHPRRSPASACTQPTG